MDETAVTVAAVTEVGEGAIALDLETPADFDAQPGQFVKLVIPVGDETHSRFYTISSSRVGDTFELTIEIDPEGEVTPVLEGLETGDEVTMAGPFGNAFYEGEEAVLVLAGGPGIGPAVGIAERALADGGVAAIVYRDESPIHGDRLDKLAEAGASIQVLDAEESLDGATGEVLSEDMQVFVYGFVDFLDEAMDAIARAGGDPEAAKVENFG